VCDLVLELREPAASAASSAVTLTIEGSETRSISLVPGQTYHVMCKDTSNSRRFDSDESLEVWRHDNSPVQIVTTEAAFPEVGVAAVYASTAVSMEANEWTLVLQQFGGRAAGLYTCQGLDAGQSVSLNIGQSKPRSIVLFTSVVQ
jgi:hypothetical protein